SRRVARPAGALGDRRPGDPDRPRGRRAAARARARRRQRQHRSGRVSAQLDALRTFVAGRAAAVPNAPVTGPSVLVVGSGKGGAGGARLDAVCACCEAGAPAYAGVPARLLVVTGTDAIALAASYALVKAARERTAAMPGGPVACAVLVNRHDDESASIGFAQI